MPEHSDRAVHRADRILDAAAALFGRYGYRKLTIDDIARQAGVGKGTVYLHWRTKQQLFEALLLRESVEYVEELIDNLRADPANLLLHRFLVHSYLIAGDRPLFRELVGGELRRFYRPMVESSLHGLDLLVLDQVFEVLTRYGLIRADIPNPQYTVSATTAGFGLLDELDPEAAALDPRAKAQALEFTIRHAFEPSKPPAAKTLTKAAEEVIAAFEGLIPPYRKCIYAYNRTDEPS